MVARRIQRNLMRTSHAGRWRRPATCQFIVFRALLRLLAAFCLREVTSDPVSFCAFNNHNDSDNNNDNNRPPSTMAASWFSPRRSSPRQAPLSPKPSSNQRRISEPIVSPSQPHKQSNQRRRTLLSRWKTPSELSTPAKMATHPRPPLPVSPIPNQVVAGYLRSPAPKVVAGYLYSPTPRHESSRVSRDASCAPLSRQPMAQSRQATLSSSSVVSCSSTDAVDLSPVNLKPATNRTLTSSLSGDSSSISDESILDGFKPRPAIRRTKENSQKAKLLSPATITSPTQCLSSESSCQSNQETPPLKPRPATNRTKRNSNMRNSSISKSGSGKEKQKRAASDSVAFSSPQLSGDKDRRHSDGATLHPKSDKTGGKATTMRLAHTQQRKKIEIGNVIPCDAAFLDTLDEEGEDSGFNLQEVYLYSDQERRFCQKYKTFHITYYHTMRYKGEIVWKLTTTSHGNSRGIYGESSSCNLSESSIRVRIRQKAGGQHNTTQKDHESEQLKLDEAGRVSNKRHVISLENILLNSAELCRSNHNSCSFASPSPTSNNGAIAAATTMAGQIINLPF